MYTDPDQGKKDFMIAWLRDAHAMEVAMEQTLRRQADHVSDDGLMHARILEHADITHRQAERTQGRLKHYGADTSTVKDLMSKFSGCITGATTWTTGDTQVKDLLMGIGAEHFEVACYRALEAAAEDLGDLETRAVAHEIRLEEQDYMLFLESSLPLSIKKALAGHATAGAI